MNQTCRDGRKVQLICFGTMSGGRDLFDEQRDTVINPVVEVKSLLGMTLEVFWEIGLSFNFVDQHC